MAIEGLTEADKAAITKASQTAGLTNQDIGAFGSLIATPQPISTATSTPTNPINLPAYPSPTPVNTSDTNAAIGAYNSSLTQSTTGTPDQYADYFKAYLQGTPQAPNYADIYKNEYASANQDANIAAQNAAQDAQDAAQARVDALNAQLAQYNYNASALIPAQAQADIAKGGAIVTKGGQAPLTAAQLRENMLAASKVQFDTLLAQTDLAAAQRKTALKERIVQAAQQHLDKMAEIHIQDATNQYNYIKDQRDKVYQFLTADRKEKMDAAAKVDDRAFTLKRDAISNQSELAKFAIQQHQSTLAGQIAGLNPDSPTFQQDLAKLQSKIIPYEKTADNAPTVKTINGVDMQWNPSSGRWENISIGQAGGEASQKALDQAKTTLTAIKSASQNAGYSGQSGFTKNVIGFFTGPGHYGDLLADTNTVRTNLMVMNSDPAVRKFFGPQMSNSDSQFMMSMSTALNPELQTPAKLRDSLKQAQDITERAYLFTSGATQVGKLDNGTRVGIFPDGTIRDLNGAQYDQNGNKLK